ncbi:LCCL domain-containing protein [Schlesneria paludicola]|uniref:LCCL domain-containing protein n=1 Tax=Schlesneria paludicola TaxID=360056 RepID=UPI00029A5992|nr:LCCL domain-containing protein [Schlesneria paludicola]
MKTRWLICFLLMLFAGVSTARAETPVNLIAGKQVEAEAKLVVGSKLVGVYPDANGKKKNYLVEIREIKANKMLKIVWIEDGSETDDVRPDELYYIGEATATRRSRTAALPEAYRSLDKNGDGQIGLYEWDRAKFAEFRKLDKNGDGFLTPQELGSTSGGAMATSGTPPKEGDPKNATANAPKMAPANLTEYKDKLKETLTFTLTGKADAGAVIGTGPYALDSNLAAVAVHAGVLKNGATGQITVSIIAPVERFAGSTMNEVTSVERNEAGPAFTIK